MSLSLSQSGILISIQHVKYCKWQKTAQIRYIYRMLDTETHMYSISAVMSFPVKRGLDKMLLHDLKTNFLFHLWTVKYVDIDNSIFFPLF